MLDPHDRTNLLEALRPPSGYALDAAVGTSFTLDLEALLTAPLAFAMFEARDTDEGQEPVGLLEAIRRHSRRITLFCQAGQIAVPTRARTVFAWLEQAVAEVIPRRPGRLFHPKVWIIRYRHRETGRAVLKVLCGTRNLTFDTSWDTLLVLESQPYATRPSTTQESTAALADAVRTLPDLAIRPLAPDRTAMLEDLADDLAHVTLIPPDPFTDVQLHVLGLDTSPAPFPDRSHQAVILSPFLGDDALADLADRHHVAALISRPESLDRIDPEVLAKVERVAVLNPSAEVDVTSGDTADGPPTEDRDPGIPLTGLHAKLYLFDTDNGSRLFTGSANVSAAAFDGNIEVLAELHGDERVSVEALLADSGGAKGFDDLLLDYTPLDRAVDPPPEEALQLSVDHLRHRIASLAYIARATSDGDAYRLTLTTHDALPTLDVDELEMTAWPATLTEQLSARTLQPGQPVDIGFPVSFEGITAFFGVRITATLGPLQTTSAFLVTADLVEAPADRHSRLLAAMLRDPERLIRYLLMLLSDPDGLGNEMADGTGGKWLARYGGSWDDVPLLEHLVRAVDRHPERLDHFHGVLRDLGEHRDTVLPNGFAELWDAVWTARQQEQA